MGDPSPSPLAYPRRVLSLGRKVRESSWRSRDNFQAGRATSLQSSSCPRNCDPIPRTTDSGPIAFPCDKTTAGPGARCGSGQETQILGRQGHPHQSCRAWLHHAGDVQDARVLLSRRAGRCLLLRTGHSPSGPTGCRPTSISHAQSEKGAIEVSTTRSLPTASATGSTIRYPLGGHTREISRESEKLARRP